MTDILRIYTGTPPALGEETKGLPILEIPIPNYLHDVNSIMESHPDQDVHPSAPAASD